MKLELGQLKVSFAEKPLPKSDKDEIGGTGTMHIMGRLVNEEYNPDLEGQKAVAVYEKMRKSDARVKSSLLVCELPFRAAQWRIKAASEDKADIDIAEFVEKNLFEGMSTTWDNTLHHILLMLPFGWMAFEKVWDIVDGQIVYRKLAPRLQKTLYKWEFDNNGSLTGMTQLVWKNNSYDFVTIPAKKLLIFTNEKEGSNFEGTSVLRNAYKHWYIKDVLYRIDSIAAELNAIGIPTGTHPSNIETAAKTAFESSLRNMSAHEQQYMRLPEGYTLDIKGVSGTVRDIMPSIDHHNKAIAESVLADFIDLGSGDKGSFALSRDKSSFFLMALGAMGKNICDTTNQYAIKPLVDYNFNVKLYPRLEVLGLETRETMAYAKAVTDLMGAGGITSDLETENALREMLHLPPKPEADVAPEPNQQSEKKIFKGADIKKKRDLTPAEQFVNFTEIDQHLNSAEEQFVAACKDVMSQQIDNLVETASKIIEKHQLDKVDGIQVRYSTQMADKIFAVLKDQMQYGKEQVKQELQKQSPNAKFIEPPPVMGLSIILELLKARSKAAAALLANKLKQFTTFEILNQIKAGTLDIAGLKQGLLDLSDRELLATAKFSVSEAFNYGRSTQAADNADDIATCQYSSILDDSTCTNCEKMDGQEWDYEDPQTDQYAGGNPNCEGGGRCRCMLVYIAKSEVRNPNG